MTTKVPTNELIEKLAASARPVRAIRLPLVLGLWFAVTFFAVAELSHGYFGCRSDLAHTARDPIFLLTVGSLMLAGFSAAYRAVCYSIPGRQPSSLSTLGLVAATLALMTAMGAVAMRTGFQKEWLTGRNPDGVACTSILLVLSILPVFFLWWSLRPLAPTEPARAARWSVAAGSLFAAAGLSFVCASGSALHLVVWHWVPIAILAALFSTLGRRLFRW